MVDQLLKDLEQDIKAQKSKKNAPKGKPAALESPRPKLNIDISTPQRNDDVKEISFRFNMKKIEKAAYLLIIILLIGYIGYDYAFVHKNLGKSGEESQSQDANAAAAAAPKPAEEVKTEPVPAAEAKTEPAAEAKVEVKEEPKAEPAAEAPKTQLSGSVEILITSVDREKRSDTLGYVNSATFTIENGKDSVFFPYVTVIAYDKSTEDAMSDKPRGTHTYATGIKSGEKYTGTISLSPKSFSNLNQDKTVILHLREKNAEGKVIDSASTTVSIS